MWNSCAAIIKKKEDKIKTKVRNHTHPGVNYLLGSYNVCEQLF